MKLDDKLKQKEASERDALLKENKELKEVIKKQMAMQSADEISESELEFILPKTRYDDVRHAMIESENQIHLVFDKSRTFMRAIPDIFVTHQQQTE
jgi:hypothetical protein